MRRYIPLAILALSTSAPAWADTIVAGPGLQAVTVVANFDVSPNSPSPGSRPDRTLLGGVVGTNLMGQTTIFVADVASPGQYQEGLYTVSGIESYTYNPVVAPWDQGALNKLLLDKVTGQILSIDTTRGAIDRIDRFGSKLPAPGLSEFNKAQLKLLGVAVSDSGMTYGGVDASGNHELFVVSRNFPVLRRITQDSTTGALLDPILVTTPTGDWATTPVSIAAMGDGSLLVANFDFTSATGPGPNAGKLYRVTAVDPTTYASSLWLDLSSVMGAPVVLGEIDIDPLSGDIYASIILNNFAGGTPDSIVKINPVTQSVTLVAQVVASGPTAILDINNFALGPWLFDPSLIGVYITHRTATSVNGVFQSGLTFVATPPIPLSPIQVIPEPTSLALLGVGALLIGVLRRRRTA